MNEKTRTMDERLIEAGFWNKEDGTFANTGHSLALVLIRMNRRLGNGVRLDFHHWILARLILLLKISDFAGFLKIIFREVFGHQNFFAVNWWPAQFIA